MGSWISLPLLLVEPDRAPPAGDPAAARWYADADAAASEAVAARNQALAQRLVAALPGLAILPPDREAALEDALDAALSAEAMIRRFHRLRQVAGDWPGGTFSATIYDGVIDAALGVDPDQPRPAQLAALEQAIGQVATATGFLAWGDGAPQTPAAAAAWLLARHGGMLDRVGQQARRRAWLLRLGLPSAAILAALALALAGLALAEAVRQGTPLHSVDATAPRGFVTARLLPVEYGLGLFPRFALEGWVEGDATAPVRLPVFRDSYLRAGPGARLTVLPTRDPATPWLLQSSVAGQGPVLGFGDIGITLFGGLVALLPLALWGLLVGWPLARRAPEARAAARIGASRLLLRVVLLGGVGAVAARLAA